MQAHASGDRNLQAGRDIRVRNRKDNRIVKGEDCGTIRQMQIVMRLQTILLAVTILLLIMTSINTIRVSWAMDHLGDLKEMIFHGLGLPKVRRLGNRFNRLRVGNNELVLLAAGKPKAAF